MAIEEAVVRTWTGRSAAGRRSLALVTICVAQLMVILDASIVNVALPSMRSALDFSSGDLAWVINAYTLAFGGLLLLGGRIGDLFGRRRMFLAGIAIFTAASLAGGFATEQIWLIVARAVQGLASAIVAPAALSLIATTFPEGKERERGMGLYGAMSGIGSVIGLVLGGVLTDGLSWRWVFFVNVPIGLVLLVLAPPALTETPTRPGRLDLPGALTGSAGMAAVVYGLIHSTGDPWSSAGTIVPLVAGGALVLLFLAIEAHTRQALMPLSMFADRNRSGAFAVMLILGTSIFTMFFSPVKAGFAFLPFAVVAMVASGIVSQTVGKTGIRMPCWSARC
jgi:MFS family permease